MGCPLREKAGKDYARTFCAVLCIICLVYRLCTFIAFYKNGKYIHLES